MERLVQPRLKAQFSRNVSRTLAEERLVDEQRLGLGH